MSSDANEGGILADPRRPRRIVAKAIGRVQGVGYRAFCADEALRLNVEGYARNRPRRP